MYEDIGWKIKSLAKGIFVVEAIVAVIAGITLLNIDEYFLLGVLTIIFGPIIAWVSSWVLYAFGELVEDVKAIRQHKYDNSSGSTISNSVPLNENIDEISDNAIPTMETPIGFISNDKWEKQIENLSTEKLHTIYLNKGDYSDMYRYMCYLELKKRL